MKPALVRCVVCAREWRSQTMAENLRAVDGCPRCGGELAFSAAAPTADAPVAASSAPAGTAPHLVLGLPRR